MQKIKLRASLKKPGNLKFQEIKLFPVIFYFILLIQIVKLTLNQPRLL